MKILNLKMAHSHVRYFRLICLLLVLMYFTLSCTKYVIMEFDEHDRQIRKTDIKPYSKSRSISEQIVALKSGDYFVCLWHCRIYLEEFENKEVQDVLHRSVFASLLRFKVNNTTLEAAYDNNLYVIETLQILDQHAEQISDEIRKTLLPILQQGVRQPEPFRQFIVSLQRLIKRNLMGGELTQSYANFTELQKNYPRWYRGYNIERIESWDFKNLLSIK